MGMRLGPRWLAAGLVVFAAQAGAADAAFTPAATLRPFASQAELQAWFEPFAVERRRLEEIRKREEAEERRRLAEERRQWEAENPGKEWEPPARLRGAAPAAAAPAPASITNNQVAGVDEGGIVKLHGQHLVILRRGRLFTVDVGDKRLAPVSAVDAFGPETNGRGWYDEMLVSGDTVAVIGYSHERGGTELVLFRIDGTGKLAYRGTWNLRSQDYYSSRNYASRLVGSKLVLYTPIRIGVDQAEPLARLPGLRRWKKDQVPAFQPIAPPTRIYRIDDTPDPQAGGVTLHSVVTCDLAQPELRCESTGVLGSAGRVFHVSPTAVYVWAMQSEGGIAGLFRLPLDGKAPSALRVTGSPIDQFSFLEQADGHLNVLVRKEGQGDGMWRGEAAGGPLWLLRTRIRDFGDGSQPLRTADYQLLPEAHGGPLQSRFIGHQLVYGAGDGSRVSPYAMRAQLHTVDVRNGTVRSMTLKHGIDRIEALGTAAAMVIGADPWALQFSTVRLGSRPAVVGRHARRGIAQAETRSHGFFYQPLGPTQGLAAVPTRPGGDPQRHSSEERAGMMYLYSDELRLAEIGNLLARPGVGRDDDCYASCADWYGNARPIFLGERMFALLGYELVEGRLARGPQGQRLLVDTRRVSFAPGSPDYRP